jgi:hypothetical protein
VPAEAANGSTKTAVNADAEVNEGALFRSVVFQSDNGTAQKAVLYEEDPNNPAGKRYFGSAVWRTELVPPAPGKPPEVAIRADIEIPAQKISVRWSLRRNDDKALPASHTVEVMFTLPPNFPHKGITNIPGVLLKQSESTRGVPLAGLAVKVTNNFFLIGLSAAEGDRARNIQLLKERAWFDIPVVYNDGRRAIIAIEKGTPGDRAFARAFDTWSNIDVSTTNISRSSALPKLRSAPVKEAPGRSIAGAPSLSMPSASKDISAKRPEVSPTTTDHVKQARIELVSEFLRELEILYRLQETANKEMAEDNSPQGKLMTGIRVGSRTLFEMNDSINRLNRIAVAGQWAKFRDLLEESHKNRMAAVDELNGMAKALLEGPKPGVNYGAMAGRSPELTAQIEQIDKTMFTMAQALFFGLVDEERVGTDGNLHHLLLTKKQRFAMISLIDDVFGWTLENRNASNIVSAAWAIKYGLTRSIYKSADEI